MNKRKEDYREVAFDRPPMLFDSRIPTNEMWFQYPDGLIVKIHVPSGEIIYKGYLYENNYQA